MAALLSATDLGEALRNNLFNNVKHSIIQWVGAQVLQALHAYNLVAT